MVIISITAVQEVLDVVKQGFKYLITTNYLFQENLHTAETLQSCCKLPSFFISWICSFKWKLKVRTDDNQINNLQIV